MNRNILTPIIGAVLVVIFALLLFTFQVRQSQVAVVTTFGKVTGPPREAGLHLRWPWPIQEVYRFDERIQNFQDHYSESLTADQQMLLTCVYVGWKITDPAEFLRSFPGGSVMAAQNRLESILRSVKLNIVGKHPLSDFVNADPTQLKFDQIEDQIETNAQEQLSTNACGMTLEFLGFTKIGLPEAVTTTVFARMKADRQRLISKWENDGKAQAQIIESAANRQAANTIANAEAEAIRIKAQGEAEAAKTTLPIFQRNPKLADFLLRLQALKASLNKKSTLIFDDRTPPFDLFQHLPTNAPSLNP